MRMLDHLVSQTSRKRSVYSLGLVIFFWTLFDGLVSYATPILITSRGFSNTAMGLIISTSSLFGAVFDFLLASIIKTLNHRRIFLALLIISLIYPLVLWSSQTAVLFIFCMAVWGLYYDLFNLGLGDFSGRARGYLANAENVSILSVFKSCGYLIAPLLTSAIVSRSSGPQFYASFFVCVSLFLFVAFLAISRKDRTIIARDEIAEDKPVFEHLNVWGKVAANLFPALAFTLMIYIFDSIIWTLGPTLSESFPGFENFGGFFVTISMIPGLTLGFLAPKFIKKIGKKKTAYICFGISNIILLPMLFVTNPFAVLSLVFLSSLFGSISFPAISSAFADYLARSKTVDREILGLKDIFVNLGYVIGPALIGLLSDKVGGVRSIAFMAIAGIVSSVLFITLTPKKLIIEE